MKFCWPQAVCILLVLVAGAQDSPPPAPSAIKITPASLDFGEQPVGTTSPPKAATVTNNGASDVTIRSILPSGIDFDQTNNCGTTLAAGAQCEIQVTFKPAIPGLRLGNLTVIVSAPPGVHMIRLNGTGK